MDLTSVGKRIRAVRAEKSLSQEQLAAATGLDRTYISRAEAGRQNMTVETLIRICGGLGVSLRAFFDFEEGRE